jgi:hypothetical protein
MPLLVNPIVPNHSHISLSQAHGSPREKHSKFGHDGAESSKRGRKTVLTRRPPPHLTHHPSHSSEEEEPKALKIHAPKERTNRVIHRYSKKTKQDTINEACGAPVYSDTQQCIDQHFWSFFHADWHWSVYHHKKKPVVETKWVDWEWMETQRNPHLNQIKAACDQLEMTKMMSFKYDWNKEVIYQFYSTLYFDADGQKLIRMIDMCQYEITMRQFACLLGLEH